MTCVSVASLGNSLGRVWGKPQPGAKNVGGVLEQAVPGAPSGSVSIDALRTVYGLTPENLEGLAARGVVVSKGYLTEAELQSLIDLKEDKRATFARVFKGAQIEEGELTNLYDELWELAAKGQLDNSAWDTLMEKYGLKEFVMSGPAFDALMGGQDGFSDGGRIVGLAEFVVAMDNLLLTLEYNSGRSGEEGYSMVLQGLCKSRNFRIINLGKFEGTVMDILKELKPDFDFSKATTADIMKAMKDGIFGDHLKNLLEMAGNWEQMLVYMLKNLRMAVANGLPQDTSQESQQLIYDKRMKTLIDLINKGKEADPKKHKALIQEMAQVLKGKTYLSFDRVEEEKTKSAKDKINYNEKTGGLERIRQTVEEVRKAREAREKIEAEKGETQ